MDASLIICIITALAVCLSVILKPEIKIGKISVGTYMIVSLVGALAILISGALPVDLLFSGLTSNDAINPIKILVLFLTVTFISVYLDELGFFEYLANRVLANGKTGQTGLFLKLYFTVALLTVFTSNDIIILTFTPFICCFTKNAKINPLPYLFAEFFAANTWSMLLIIGNPTNIYLATSCGADFFEYLKIMVLPTVFAGGVSLLILFLIFRKTLKTKIERDAQANVNLNKTLVTVGVVHLAVCIVLLAISSYIGLEMYIITSSLALSLAVFTLIYKAVKKEGGAVLIKSLRRLPYQLVPFVLSMFTLVLSLEYSGNAEKIAEALCALDPIISVGVSSFLISNVINNIPMSVLFGAILASPSFAANSLGGMYAAVVGSNIGAYFTPVGALAGIMWLSILKKSDVNISFGKFVKYGAATSIPTLLAALLALKIVL